MFKIVENTNGTTSIFCNQSGQLVCTVHSRKSSLVGVSRPIQKEGARNNGSGIHLRDSYVHSGIHNGYESHFTEDGYDTMSCMSYSSSDSEDPPDDCIDQISFLQSFDLVSSDDIHKNSLSALKSTFPRRKISRVEGKSSQKHFSVQRQENIFENIKLFDEVELCSPLGRRVIDSSQKHLDEREVSTAIKKYEKYCQISVLSVHPNTINLPQLRCRDTLKYPITFRPTKFFKSYWSHSYSFGHRQRDNHYRTLKTGLNERSRRLKRLCRKMQVSLCRLPKCDLRFYTAQLSNTSHSIQQKRTTTASEKLPPVTCSMVNDTQQKCFESLNLISGTRHSCNERWCAVKIENVLKSLVLIDNKVYVKNTNITVPEHYILELAIKKPPNILRMKKINCIKNNSRTVEWVRLNNTSFLDQSQTIKENALPSLEEIQNNIPHLKGDSKVSAELNRQIQDYKSKQLPGRKRRVACSLPFCQNTFKGRLKQEHDCTFCDEDASVLRSRKRCQLRGAGFTEPNGKQLSSNDGGEGYHCRTLRTVAEKSPKNKGMLQKLLSSNNATERIPLQQKCQMLNETNHHISDSVPNKCYSSQENSSVGIFTLKNTVNSSMKNVTTDKPEITITSYRSSWVKPSLCDDVSVKKNGQRLTPSEQIPENIFPAKFLSLDASIESGNNTDILPSLTLTADNEKPKTIKSSYIFQCHGCGFKASYESNREKLNNANRHMISYHSVKEPNSFLAHTSVMHDGYLEMITEGFPSYKSTDFSEL